MKTIFLSLGFLITVNLSYAQDSYLHGRKIELRTTPSRLGMPHNTGFNNSTTTQNDRIMVAQNNNIIRSSSQNCPDGKCLNLVDYASVDEQLLLQLVEIRKALLKVPNFNKYPQLTRANADISDLIGRIKVRQ